MATVNFSVPDEVKAEFDKTFGGQKKSAVIDASVVIKWLLQNPERSRNGQSNAANGARN